MALGHELLAVAAMAGRICAGLIFVLAATQKALHWGLLSGVIANYRLLPRGLVGAVAALLPPLEMAVGLLLLSAQFRPVGAMAAFALLAVFAVAMAINLKRGRSHIDCGCGQSFLKQALDWILVWRNAGLMVLLLPSLFPAKPISLSDILTGTAAGLGLFLLYLILNIFAALPATRRFA